MHQEIVFQAIEFAAQAHWGQFRKGSDLPYMVHPLGVARILIECRADKEVVAAGLLHDTVEDTRVTLAEIERDFGPRVARLVEGASEPDRSETWEKRKRHTLAHLRTAPAEVLLVVGADKLDNIRSIQEDLTRLGAALWDRFNRPREAQKWYYASLVEVLGERLQEEPAASLFRVFAEAVRQVFGGGEEALQTWPPDDA